jgi:Uri superfamily endonuclease
MTRAPGAYLLVVDLDQSLPLDGTALAPAVLPPGRYAYCGSAYGPGGLGARIGRHLRRGKALRWHIDRLTEAGRVLCVGWRPQGRECALLAGLRQLPGVTVPVAGFGSSDCRGCPAHLVSVAGDFDAETLTAALGLTVMEV